MGAKGSGNHFLDLEILTPVYIKKQKETLLQNFLCPSFYNCFWESQPNRSHHCTLFQQNGFRSDIWLPSWPKLKLETFKNLCNLAFVNVISEWISSSFPKPFAFRERVSLFMVKLNSFKTSELSWVLYPLQFQKGRWFKIKMCSTGRWPWSYHLERKVTSLNTWAQRCIQKAEGPQRGWRHALLRRQMVSF